jgi:hypothetical protein
MVGGVGFAGFWLGIEVEVEQEDCAIAAVSLEAASFARRSKKPGGGGGGGMGGDMP